MSCSWSQSKCPPFQISSFKVLTDYLQVGQFFPLERSSCTADLLFSFSVGLLRPLLFLYRYLLVRMVLRPSGRPKSCPSPFQRRLLLPYRHQRLLASLAIPLLWSFPAYILFSRLMPHQQLLVHPNVHSSKPHYR